MHFHLSGTFDPSTSSCTFGVQLLGSPTKGGKGVKVFSESLSNDPGDLGCPASALANGGGNAISCNTST